MVQISLALPEDFRFGEVTAIPRVTGLAPVAPPLGPLATFTGAWIGSGFNTIFRPLSGGGPDNILELNLTSEQLTFSADLGSVPNRGFVQPDIFFNGVPYLQAISDVTSGPAVGIHVEPGIWIAVPSTTNPREVATFTRMASIPHGVTIEAQGTSTTHPGAPNIPAVSITPTAQGHSFVFPSQTAATASQFRIPHDLTTFIAAGTITQAILNDPNTVLRNHIHNQNIVSTDIISINTQPVAPITGGGTSNIAFLTGGAPGNQPNARAVQMSATFWIETVEEIIIVPPFKPGEPPLTIEGASEGSGRIAPKFIVRPPIEIVQPRRITIQFKQIQYSQNVILVFNGLNWPHVSVATLTSANGTVVTPVGGW